MTETQETSRVVTINLNRSPKFGFGYSTRPTGVGTQIAEPKSPVHTGTVKQVRQAVKADRVLQSLQATAKQNRFFYGDSIIDAVQYGESWVEPSWTDFWNDFSSPETGCGKVTIRLRRRDD